MEAQLWGEGRERVTRERLTAWNGQPGGSGADYDEYVACFLMELVGRERGYLDVLPLNLPDGIALPAFDDCCGGSRWEELGCYYQQVDGTMLPLAHDLLPGMRVNRPLCLGGYASARGLAAWWCSWLPDEQRSLFMPRPGAGARWYSKTLLREVEFDRGIFVDFGRFLEAPRFTQLSFGHVGWCGVSVGLADPVNKVAVGMVMNSTDVGHDRFFESRRDLLQWGLDRGLAWWAAR